MTDTKNIEKAYEKLQAARAKVEAVGEGPAVTEARQAIDHAVDYVLGMVDAKTARKIRHPHLAAQIDAEG